MIYLEREEVRVLYETMGDIDDEVDGVGDLVFEIDGFTFDADVLHKIDFWFVDIETMYAPDDLDDPNWDSTETFDRDDPIIMGIEVYDTADDGPWWTEPEWS